MTHEEIHRRDLVEAYIRRQLPEPDRLAVEEHLFDCDECFAEAESLQRFVDGVRDAVESGSLHGVGQADVVPARAWFRPAFFSSMAASAVFAAASVWALFVEIPKLRRESAVERQASQSTAARLEQEIASLRQRPELTLSAQANLPLLMLEASRAAGSATIRIPAGAESFALWLEPSTSPPDASYRLEIQSATGEAVVTLDGLRKNPYGALAVSIPSARVPKGAYRARLFLIRTGNATLAAEYRFEVSR